MTTPMYGQGAGDRPPQIRFDAIGEAWTLLRANMGTWVLLTLVYIVVVEAIQFAVAAVLSLVGLGGGGYGMGRQPSGMDSSNMGKVFFGQGLAMVISFAISAFFTGGFFRAAIKQVRNETVSIGDLFTCGDVIGALMGAMILQGLAIELGFALCIVPGIFVAGATMFTVPLIVDKRMGAIEALQTSWDTLKSQAWAAAGFYFVAGLASALGVLLCGIGMLITLPILYLSVAILYRDFFGGGTLGPQIEMPFPQQGFVPGSMPGMQQAPPPQGPTPGSFDV